jgi:hypothetical protein
MTTSQIQTTKEFRIDLRNTIKGEVETSVYKYIFTRKSDVKKYIADCLSTNSPINLDIINEYNSYYDPCSKENLYKEILDSVKHIT